MAKVVRSEWFGRRVTVLMANDKSMTGTLSEVTEGYIALTRNDSETLIMCHAIVAIRLAGEKDEQS